MTTPADHSFYYDPREESGTMTFDIKCFELAAHFISDFPEMNGSIHAERYRNELAARIQNEIEIFIQFRTGAAPSSWRNS